MATSCCPSWRMMARRLFPAESGNISMTYTPMVYTARLVKRERPDCKVVFVGPCAAKKLEAMQDDIRTDVDFVLTYEELMGIFEARDIDFSQLPDSPDLDEGTRAGRGFLPSRAAWPPRWRSSSTRSIPNARSKPSGPTACASAGSF